MSKSNSYIEASGHTVTKRPNGTLDVSLSFVNDPGRTEQSHANACDISYILAQHVRAGVSPQVPEGVFNDLTQIVDYQTALNVVDSIHSIFESLPLKVRVAYDHNPSLFMQAVEDPSERDKLVELGVFMTKDGHSSGEGKPEVVIPKPKAEGAI